MSPSGHWRTAHAPSSSSRSSTTAPAASATMANCSRSPTGRAPPRLATFAPGLRRLHRDYLPLGIRSHVADGLSSITRMETVVGPTSAPGLGSPPPTSAPGLGSPPATSAPGLGSPRRAVGESVDAKWMGRRGAAWLAQGGGGRPRHADCLRNMLSCCVATCCTMLHHCVAPVSVRRGRTM